MDSFPLWCLQIYLILFNNLLEWGTLLRVSLTLFFVVVFDKINHFQNYIAIMNPYEPESIVSKYTNNVSSGKRIRTTSIISPLLTSCQGLSDPSFPIKRVLEVARVSNRTSSIASYLTWLDRSQHPCLAWGTHCASPQRDSSRSDSGRRTGFSLGPSFRLGSVSGGHAGGTSKKSNFKKSALTFPCLAGPPSLSPESSFSSGDFLGVIGCPLL